MTRLKTILAASLLSVSALAFTANAKPNADTNQDGEISRAEFDAMSQEKFAKSDLNGDGYISKDERETSRQNRAADKRAEHFKKLDANGDGFISQSEFESGADEKRERFKEKRRSRMDANKDGEVTSEDRALMREKYQAKREARKAQRESSGDESRKDRRSDKRGHWAKLDINGDELISAQEHMIGAAKMFEHMDANGDNVLSEGEGKRRHKKRRRMFGR